MSQVDVEGEVLAEEDAEPGEATGAVRPLPQAYEGQSSALAVLRPEVKTAALAAAGGVLAGAATVAAVRAVSAVGSRQRAPRRIGGRRQRPAKVVASRSFLVDVHLLGR
ncbi:MAG TPA: hypothetical protein VFJ57_16100 [Solirubrobacterales bacterium]|nr:hypothetical protein [Solirubrobacterales bacterium]